MGPHKLPGKPMAAKSKPAPKRKEVPGQKPPKEDGEDAAQLRRDTSNMITSLRNSKDQVKVDLLAKYKSLPRFDIEKHNILKQWKMDKSCKWASSYLQEVSQEKSSKQSELEGYGTRPVSCNETMIS